MSDCTFTIENDTGSSFDLLIDMSTLDPTGTSDWIAGMEVNFENVLLDPNGTITPTTFTEKKDAAFGNFDYNAWYPGGVFWVNALSNCTIVGDGEVAGNPPTKFGWVDLATPDPATCNCQAGIHWQPEQNTVFRFTIPYSSKTGDIAVKAAQILDSQFPPQEFGAVITCGDEVATPTPTPDISIPHTPTPTPDISIPHTPTPTPDISIPHTPTPTPDISIPFTPTPVPVPPVGAPLTKVNNIVWFGNCDNQPCVSVDISSFSGVDKVYQVKGNGTYSDPWNSSTPAHLNPFTTFECGYGYIIILKTSDGLTPDDPVTISGMVASSYANENSPPGNYVLTEHCGPPPTPTPNQTPTPTPNQTPTPTPIPSITIASAVDNLDKTATITVNKENVHHWHYEIDGPDPQAAENRGTMVMSANSATTPELSVGFHQVKVWGVDDNHYPNTTIVTIAQFNISQPSAEVTISGEISDNYVEENGPSDGADNLTINAKWMVDGSFTASNWEVLEYKFDYQSNWSDVLDGPNVIPVASGDFYTNLHIRLRSGTDVGIYNGQINFTFIGEDNTTWTPNKNITGEVEDRTIELLSLVDNGDLTATITVVRQNVDYWVWHATRSATTTSSTALGFDQVADVVDGSTGGQNSVGVTASCDGRVYWNSTTGTSATVTYNCQFQVPNWSKGGFSFMVSAGLNADRTVRFETSDGVCYEGQLENSGSAGVNIFDIVENPHPQGLSTFDDNGALANDSIWGSSMMDSIMTGQVDRPGDWDVEVAGVDEEPTPPMNGGAHDDDWWGNFTGSHRTTDIAATGAHIDTISIVRPAPVFGIGADIVDGLPQVIQSYVEGSGPSDGIKVELVAKWVHSLGITISSDDGPTFPGNAFDWEVSLDDKQTWASIDDWVHSWHEESSVFGGYYDWNTGPAQFDVWFRLKSGQNLALASAASRDLTCLCTIIALGWDPTIDTKHGQADISNISNPSEHEPAPVGLRLKGTVYNRLIDLLSVNQRDDSVRAELSVRLENVTRWTYSVDDVPSQVYLEGANFIFNAASLEGQFTTDDLAIGTHTFKVWGVDSSNNKITDGESAELSLTIIYPPSEIILGTEVWLEQYEEGSGPSAGTSYFSIEAKWLQSLTIAQTNPGNWECQYGTTGWVNLTHAEIDLALTNFPGDQHGQEFFNRVYFRLKEGLSAGDYVSSVTLSAIGLEGASWPNMTRTLSGVVTPAPTQTPTPIPPTLTPTPIPPTQTPVPSADPTFGIENDTGSSFDLLIDMSLVNSAGTSGWIAGIEVNFENVLLNPGGTITPTTFTEKKLAAFGNFDYNAWYPGGVFWVNAETNCTIVGDGEVAGNPPTKFGWVDLATPDQATCNCEAGIHWQPEQNTVFRFTIPYSSKTGDIAVKAAQILDSQFPPQEFGTSL